MATPGRTPRLALDPEHPDPAALARAAAILRSGGLVAFGTETVYGLGADAANPDAVRRIFEAKGRPSFNPLIVHCEGIERARSCAGMWSDEAELLARTFWPGPLTLVLPRNPDLIPDLVTAGEPSVGLRVPATRVARLLIAQADRPIAAPSANRSTGISPTTADHVLKDLEGRIELVLDSGPCRVGLESTVLDLMETGPRILRPGAIGAEAIAAILGRPVEEIGAASEDRANHAKLSPGQMRLHYAPRTRCRLIRSEELPAFGREKQRALLAPGRPELAGASSAIEFAVWADVREAGEKLYATLHAWDAGGFDEILIVLPPETPEWKAVADRLRRASAERD